MVGNHAPARGVGVGNVLGFPLPLVCQRLDGGKWGRFGTAQTFEDEEKKGNVDNRTRRGDDYDEGLAEFNDSHPLVERGRAGETWRFRVEKKSKTGRWPVVRRSPKE